MGFRAASIPCYVVSGMNKSAAYQVGDHVHRKQLGAQWNTILVDGQWRLIDVFWASTCVVGKQSKDWALVDIDGDMQDELQEGDDDIEDEEKETQHRVNEFFFLPDPDKLIRTHFPDDVRWQLLSEPKEVDEFESEVYIRERYHQLKMGMNNRSKKDCVVHTVAGETEIYFTLPSDQSPDIDFKYLLYKQRQKSDDHQFVPMDQFVIYQKTSNGLSFIARFPVAGRFKMDVFGQNLKDHNTLDMICSYIIECAEPMKNCQPLPDNPEIGWGPGAEAEKAGLQAKTHSDGIIKTDDGHVEMRFDLKNPMNVLQNLRNNDLDEWLLKRHAVIRIEDGEMIIDMRLPQSGEYALNLFADETDKEGDMPNVCNYLIHCQNEGVNTAPFPRLHDGILGKSHLSDKLNVVPLSHPGGLIQTEVAKVDISFSVPEDVELFCELHNTGKERKVTADEFSKSSMAGTDTFNLDMQCPGEYGLNIYAKRKSEGNRMYHVHTYLLEYLSQGYSAPQPIKDEVIVEIIYLSKDEIELTMPSGEHPLVPEFQKKNAQEAPQKDQIKCSTVEDQQVFTVKLPELGEYKLDILESRDNGALVHIKTYQITRHEPTEEDLEAEAQAAEKAAQVSAYTASLI